MPISRSQIQAMFLSDAERAKLQREELFNRSRYYSTDNNLLNTGLNAAAGFVTGGGAGALYAAGKSVQSMSGSPEHKVAFNPIGSAAGGAGAKGLVDTLSTPKYDAGRSFEALPQPGNMPSDQGPMPGIGTPARPREAYLSTQQGPDVQELGLALQGVQTDNLGGALAAIGESRSKKEDTLQKIQFETIKFIQEQDRKMVDLAEKEADRTLKPITTVLASGKKFTTEPSKTVLRKIDNEAVSRANEQAKRSLQPVTIDLSNGTTFTAVPGQKDIEAVAASKERLRQSAIKLANDIKKNNQAVSRQLQITPNKIMEMVQANVKTAATSGTAITFEDAFKQVESSLKNLAPALIPSGMGGKSPAPTSNQKTITTSSGRKFSLKL